MEPRHILSAAKHVRTKGLALVGAVLTLLLVLLSLLLGIAMYIKPFLHDDSQNLHMRNSSFVITDPSIQMARRLTISAARHAQEVRTVHKEGLQLELTVVLLVKVLFFPSPVCIIVYISLRSAVCQAPGCQNPPHSLGNGPGPGYDYCSMAHKM